MKRLLSFTIVLIMFFSLLPVSALAEDGGDVSQTAPDTDYSVEVTEPDNSAVGQDDGSEQEGEEDPEDLVLVFDDPVYPEDTLNDGVIDTDDPEAPSLLIAPEEVLPVLGATASNYLDSCTVYRTYIDVMVKKSGYMKSLPCSAATDSSSTNIRALTIGEILICTQVVKNSAGNYWYKTTEGGYIFAGDTTYVGYMDDEIKIKSVSKNWNLGYPKLVAIKSSYSISGTVYSNYCDICKVGAFVYSGTATSGTAVIKAEDTGLSTKSYDLNAGAINTNLKFANITTKGDYNYVIKAAAKYYYSTDGTTMSTETSPYMIVVQKTFKATGTKTTPASVTESQASAKIETLKSALNGYFFTTDGATCHSSWESGHGCSDCAMINVVQSSWLMTKLNYLVPVASIQGSISHYYYGGSITNGQSCAGFANFAGWYIFAGKNTDKVTFSQYKTGSFNATTMANAKPGDILRLGASTSSGTHSAIFIKCVDGGVQVLQCNWDSSDGNCKITVNTIKYSSSYNYVTISRASNYDIPAVTYTVSYNANGGSGAPASQTKTQGKNLTLSSTVPVRTGYQFLYWNTKADGSGTTYNPGATYTADANLTLYAIWQQNQSTYTVTYSSSTYIDRLQYGTTIGNVPSSQTKNSGQNLILSDMIPTVSLEGYEFSGWSTSIRGGVEYQPGGVYSTDADVTLYARFAPGYYTVTIDANGGTASKSTMTVWYGSDYDYHESLPTAQREGYEFLGWFTEPDGGTLVTNDTRVTIPGNHTLYAHWENPNARTYTVTYLSSAELVAEMWDIIEYPGDVEATNIPAPQIKTEGEDLVLSTVRPTVDAEGFEFVCWADSSGKGYYPGTVYDIDEDLVLHPWAYGKEYYAYYDANGGEFNYGLTVKKLDYVYGSKIVDLFIPSSVSRNGYVFTGWFTDPVAGTEIIRGESYYTIPADQTWYAHWESEDPVTGAAITVESVTASPGSQITVPVTISDNPGIISMEFSVAYDDTVLEWTGVTRGEFDGTYDLAAGYPITWITDDTRTDMTDDGVIAYLTFNVKADAVSGTTAISVSYDPNYIYNADEDNVYFTTVSGTVTIASYLPGDINGDGSVSNKDVTRLMRYIKYHDVTVVEAALDVNGDGAVSNKDVTRLMRYIKYGDVDIH